MNKTIRDLAIIASVALVARRFLGISKVSGNSMFPELHDGDELLLDKTSYLTKDPARGEVVIFQKQTGDRKMLVKRIIGLPGDRVVIKDGVVTVNETALSGDYTMDGVTPGDVDVTVPEGQFFVLGDNRENSLDSRSDEVGCVPKEALVGKAAFRLYPPGRVFTRSE